MGSKISLELKEGHHCLKIDKSLVGEFQDRIFVTDKAMSSFVKAIDSTEAACEELLRRLHASGSSSAPGSSSSETDKEMELTDTQRAAKLLWSIKECVSDHKFVVLECFSKLVKLIIDTGSDFIQFGDVLDLSIDKYRGSHNVEDTPYYDTRIEMLQTDINLLKHKLKQKNEETEIFKDKELNFSKQQVKYLKRIDDLQRNIDVISAENARLDEMIHHAKEKLEKHGIAYVETKTVRSCPIFLEVKFEKLKREVQVKNQMYEMEKENVVILNEREQIHCNEKEIYLRRMKELDKEVKTIVSMNHGLTDKLTDALEQLERQSIEVDCWKRREKISKQDYEKLERETGEYRTKVNNFFHETSHLVDKMTVKSIKTEHDLDVARGNDGSKHLGKESFVDNDENQRNNYNTENDPTVLDKFDVQIEEIRNYLTLVKEKLKNCYDSDSQDAEGEIQLKERVEDDNEQDSGVVEKRSETSMLKAEIILLKQEMKTLKEKRIMHVQVYAEYSLKACAQGEQDFLKVLEASMGVGSVELRIEELKSTTVAIPGIPLLILYTRSYSYMYWSNNSADLLCKFNLSKKVALVTFHRREKNNIWKSDVPDEYLQKLGGSYDFGFRNSSNDYVFDEKTFNAVIEFIRNNNHREIQTEEKISLGR